VFELGYGTQLIMPTKFTMPIQQTQNKLKDKVEMAIQVMMENLIQLDEDHWQAKENGNTKFKNLP
jgi:hypothetical protein